MYDRHYWFESKVRAILSLLGFTCGFSYNDDLYGKYGNIIIQPKRTSLHCQYKSLRSVICIQLESTEKLSKYVRLAISLNH